MVLFINSCIGDKSRTEQIARAYIKKYPEITEVHLDSYYLEPLNSASLEMRDQYAAGKKFDHGYFEAANLFKNADEIVIAAPFWDLSFPAKLRIYLENICITGLTFRYSENGEPVGMCKAGKLVYITTSGGTYIPDYSYDYIKMLAGSFFGIRQTELVYAENLDIVGNDPQQIVENCINQYCR